MAVRRPYKQRASSFHLGDIFPGQAAVIHEPASILIGTDCRIKERAVEFCRCLLMADSLGKFAEHIDPGIDIRRTVIDMHHGHIGTIGGCYNVNVPVYSLQGFIQYIHGERRSTDRNIACALAHAVGRYHAGASIAFWRCHECSGLQGSARVKKFCPGFRQMASLHASPQGFRQNSGQIPRHFGDFRQVVKDFNHARIIIARCLINGEHA